MPKSLFMETTTVPLARSAAEIIECLVRSGARSIQQQYDERGQLTGIAFAIPLQGILVHYALPARVEPVYGLLRAKKKGHITDRDKATLKEKAGRIAWRQLLRWVEAQMAMIEVGMLHATEVFMPYAVDQQSGRTVYQLFVENGVKRLAAPASEGSRA